MKKQHAQSADPEVEQVKAEVKLNTSSRNQGKRQLGELKQRVIRSQIISFPPRDFSCSVCAASPSTPVAPSGIWLCEQHRLLREYGQLQDFSSRPFLEPFDRNRVNTLKLIVKELGMPSTDGYTVKTTQGLLWSGLIAIQDIDAKVGKLVPQFGKLTVEAQGFIRIYEQEKKNDQR